MKSNIKVGGMHCESCVKRIENVLEKIKGVQKFSVNLEEKNITLEVKNEKIIEQVKEKIKDLGFEVQE